MIKNAAVIILIFINIIVIVSCNKRITCYDESLYFTNISIENNSISRKLDFMIVSNTISISLSENKLNDKNVCNQVKTEYKTIIQHAKNIGQGSKRYDISDFNIFSKDTSVAIIEDVKIDSSGKYGQMYIVLKDDGIFEVMAVNKSMCLKTKLSIKDSKVVSQDPGKCD